MRLAQLGQAEVVRVEGLAAHQRRRPRPRARSSGVTSSLSPNQKASTSLRPRPALATSRILRGRRGRRSLGASACFLDQGRCIWQLVRLLGLRAARSGARCESRSPSLRCRAHARRAGALHHADDSGCMNWWSAARIVAACRPPSVRASKRMPSSARATAAGVGAAGASRSPPPASRPSPACARARSRPRGSGKRCAEGRVERVRRARRRRSDATRPPRARGRRRPRRSPPARRARCRRRCRSCASTPASRAALTSSVRSLPQLPVSTACAPLALILAA